MNFKILIYLIISCSILSSCINEDRIKSLYVMKQQWSDYSNAKNNDQQKSYYFSYITQERENPYNKDKQINKYCSEVRFVNGTTKTKLYTVSDYKGKDFDFTNGAYDLYSGGTDMDFIFYLAEVQLVGIENQAATCPEQVLFTFHKSMPIFKEYKGCGIQENDPTYYEIYDFDFFTEENINSRVCEKLMQNSDSLINTF